MHNMPCKSTESIVRAKTEASCAFQKSFFEHSKYDFGSSGVWVFENRQKLLSPHANRLVCVVWSQQLYQQIPWTLWSVFHMHNMPWKSTESIVRAKNEASRAFKKSFFWHSKLDFGSSGVWFFENRQNSLSSREIISTCSMTRATNYDKHVDFENM